VIKSTGFMKGLFTDVEMNSNNVKVALSVFISQISDRQFAVLCCFFFVHTILLCSAFFGCVCVDVCMIN